MLISHASSPAFFFQSFPTVTNMKFPLYQSKNYLRSRIDFLSKPVRKYRGTIFSVYWPDCHCCWWLTTGNGNWVLDFRLFRAAGWCKSCAGLSLLFVFTEKLRRELVLFKDESRLFFLPLQKRNVFAFEAEYRNVVKRDLIVMKRASFHCVAEGFEPQGAVQMG